VADSVEVQLVAHPQHTHAAVHEPAPRDTSVSSPSGARVVVGTTDTVGDEVAHRFGILAVEEKVRGDT
jgi:hypothetical protein